MNQLQNELARRAQAGHFPVTIESMEQQLNALGYKLDRNMDCHSNNRWMNGPSAGESYPAINTRVKEMDTGVLYGNINARKDSKSEALGRLLSSGELFSVTKSAILEI
ncbi:MAG: hypothetical protein ACTS9Y_00570 [Methylophilus sp.]|uniref:hypothetical protein n=1 Tax=Methylophilus sp. TaxID=29541 RepID=UPI003FA0FCCA